MSIINALVGPVAGLLDQFIEDKDQKARLAHDIATMSEKHMSEAMIKNADANIAQSKHGSLFVAGARPAIMWICALGLLTQFFFDADSGMGGRYMDARYRSTKAKYWRIDDAHVVTVGSWRVKEL